MLSVVLNVIVLIVVILNVVMLMGDGGIIHSFKKFVIVNCNCKRFKKFYSKGSCRQLIDCQVLGELPKGFGFGFGLLMLFGIF